MAFAYKLDRWRGASFRNDELIDWDNLTPQQACVKQAEILYSSPTLTDSETGS